MTMYAAAHPLNYVYYLSYLVIGIGLTTWVGKVLRRHGAIFLADSFPENATLAISVNRLLMMGYYMVSAGYLIMTLTISYPINTLADLLNNESWKVGLELLILGIAHSFNLLVFAKMRNRGANPSVAELRG